MLYELRRYRIQPGCMAAMHTRMQHTLFPWFAQCGVPRPLAVWETMGGSGHPVMTWMLRWNSFDQRQAAWAGLYPLWQKLRADNTAQEEFVLQTGITLMVAWPELPLRGCEICGGVDELWIRSVVATQGARARQTFLESEAPVLERAGARIMAGFDFLFGEALPQQAIFMTWPDEETRSDGLSAYDNDPAVAASHRRDRLAFGKPVAESTERLALRPAPYL